ncbi:hypothetical protein ORD22_15040, partial [Sporosarcina sp. GW1-11]|uniref:hypothetical protein n=1 Tax=Sporosarcina sp. GW1-11 TaxID=2899126 RepID=UPI00294CFA37
TCFSTLNEGALQAVGGAIRRIGALPIWLIVGAIRQRRSGFSDESLHYIQKRIEVSGTYY